MRHEICGQQCKKAVLQFSRADTTRSAFLAALVLQRRSPIAPTRRSALLYSAYVKNVVPPNKCIPILCLQLAVNVLFCLLQRDVHKAIKARKNTTVIYTRVEFDNHRPAFEARDGHEQGGTGKIGRGAGNLMRQTGYMEGVDVDGQNRFTHQSICVHTRAQRGLQWYACHYARVQSSGATENASCRLFTDAIMADLNAYNLHEQQQQQQSWTCDISKLVCVACWQ